MTAMSKLNFSALLMLTPETKPVEAIGFDPKFEGLRNLSGTLI